MSHRSIGICLGASTLKAVVLVEDGGLLRIEKRLTRAHESDPRQALLALLDELGPGPYDYGVVTGRKFRTVVNLRSITEPEAVEHGLKFRRRTDSTPFRAVASLGAENFVVYVLDGQGHISTVETGNKCASGTGEFFLQQVGRMAVSPAEAVELAGGAEEYKVSGRCTVFCKSDCTHALNKGVPIGRVSAGLCRMMAEKIMELLEKVDKDNLLAIGGVTKNSVIMQMLDEKVGNLVVPDEADVFEALGAAHYALENRIPWEIDREGLFLGRKVSFDFLPPIADGAPLVRFEESPMAVAEAGDECIVGLDVGSTTTKAVLLRTRDDAVLASIYLRTNGNPVKASRECYRALSEQIAVPVDIVAIGTTGSGRHIAGLHAGTDAIINEIIAHATGAAYFDPEVDTIFEIGGQDAKYTYLTNGVPSDYAMNEACSAGTGSFLEEAAKESLGLDYREIGKVALEGRRPPNFNDQCAAFISSDIKTAVHEGIERENIVAGLVYSIGMNYVNRVKGQRQVGRKVFMQGGVCYNPAVPLAMANLLGKEIIVPPNPGLMGAFGVALEVKDRMKRGVIARGQFGLGELAAREIEYGKSFKCAGGKEKCDRGCEIAMMILDGKKFPFGGACNKYYNQVHHITHDPAEHDYVKIRQELVFQRFAAQAPAEPRFTVGINRSFLVNQYFPLWSHWFAELGGKVVLSDGIDPEGVKRKRAQMCYPCEISHGAYANLLAKKPDYVFMPKLFSLPVAGGNGDRKWQSTCLLVQSEAYWLSASFKGVDQPKWLAPQLDFNDGLLAREDVFGDLAGELGRSRKEGIEAFRKAVGRQEAMLAEFKEMGRQVLRELDEDPEAIAVVLFGRPYNAFAREGNLAIPGKFASRGVKVIPWDCLPFEDVAVDPDINWAIGQNLLRAAKIVSSHPRLFGTWITNFSCGPDSFLVGYFREIMKSKPSLTLELDSHSADAGITTRVEAFLDIVGKYLQLNQPEPAKPPFRPAELVIEDRVATYIASDGEHIPLKDPRCHLVFPSMGPLGTDALAAIFNGIGIRATGLPVPDFEVLKLGRGNTACKECLPLLLVTGSMLQYLKSRTEAGEKLVYFMPTSAGGCRLTQYNVFLRKLVQRQRIEDVAFMSLTNTNGYAGLATSDVLNALKAIMVSDVMEDMHNALRVLACDWESASRVFDAQWQRVLANFREDRCKGLYALLDSVSTELRKIPLKHPLKEAITVSLHGEMYVRRDHFSCQDLVERLAGRGIVARRAHVFEYMAYSDYNVDQNVWQNKRTLRNRAEHRIKVYLQSVFEKKIKKALAKSGLYDYELLDIPGIVEYGKEFFDVRFSGESIVVVGAFFKDMLHTAHGVISIGPFACMPTRIIEAVLGVDSSLETKLALDRATGNHGTKHSKHAEKLRGDVLNLPFLSIESDGNPFPQILDARIEAFCLQVERLHGKVRAVAKH